MASKSSLAPAVVHYAADAFSVASLGIPMGRRLLAEHPNNRWILLAQGGLLLQEGDAGGEEAADAFLRILALPNQHPDFLHRLFRSWSWLGLAEAYRDGNPTRARRYLGELIACEECPNRAQATALLEELDVDSGDRR